MSIEQDVLDKMQSRQATEEWVAGVVAEADKATRRGRKSIIVDDTKSAWTTKGKEVSAQLNRYRAKYPDTHGFHYQFQIRATRVSDSRTAGPTTRVMFLLIERLFDELGENPSEELRGQLVYDIQHLYREVVERTMGNRITNGTTLKGASRPRTKAIKRKEPAAAAAAAASSMQAEASDDEEEDRQVKPKPDAMAEKYAVFNSLLLPLMQPAHFFVPQVRSANELDLPVATYGAAKELDSPVATYGMDALLEAAASQNDGLGLGSQSPDTYDALTEDLEPLAHMPPARGDSLLMERPNASELAFAHNYMTPIAPPVRAGSNPLVAHGAFPCDYIGCSVMTDDPSGFCPMHRQQTGYKGSTRHGGPGACDGCRNPLIEEVGDSQKHCARCVFLSAIR